MCIKHRNTVTKTRRSKYCHQHLQQLKLPDQLHKSIRQYSNIAPAMIQQNCIGYVLCHQAIHYFAEFAYQVQRLGPTDTRSTGCTMQSDYNRTVGTHMQLSLYTLILSVWFGLAVCLHMCPQAPYCMHRTTTISKDNIACIKVHHHTSEKWLDSAVTKCTF